MTHTTRDAWITAINTILDDGHTYIDGDNRQCTEANNLKIRIDDPENAAIDHPYEELRSHPDWVYPTKQQLLDVIFDDDHINSLDYTYGARLLNFDNAINQVKDYIIPLLRDNPTSRRAIAQIYDPRLDSNPDKASTPGIIYIAFQLRSHNLHCTACLRSNDVFYGYPANIIQIHHVHRWVATKLGADQASITTVSNSAHVFHDAHDDIKTILGADINHFT